MSNEEYLKLELKKLENVPPLSPEEQVIVDLIAGFMVDQHFDDIEKGKVKN